MIKKVGAVGAALVGLFIVSPAAIAADVADAGKDIVETAVSTGGFETLAAALEAAGLIETLKGQGPFTVFAPTDAAFAKLPQGTLEDLLLPENKGQLRAILTYHVTTGEVLKVDILALPAVTTVHGSALAVGVDGKTVTVNDARVTEADIMTANGVIHVIDTVLLPASK